MDNQGDVTGCWVGILDKRTTHPPLWFVISAYLLAFIWRIATKIEKSRKNVVIVYETTWLGLQGSMANKT